MSHSGTNRILEYFSRFESVNYQINLKPYMTYGRQTYLIKNNFFLKKRIGMEGKSNRAHLPVDNRMILPSLISC